MGEWIWSMKVRHRERILLLLFFLLSPHSVTCCYSVYWSLSCCIRRCPLHAVFTWFMWFVQSRLAVKSTSIWNSRWDEKEQQLVLFSTSVHSVLEQCVYFAVRALFRQWLDESMFDSKKVLCVRERERDECHVTRSSFTSTNSGHLSRKYCDDCVSCRKCCGNRTVKFNTSE